MALSPIIVRPTTRHTATFIFLHGLGDTGHGWSQGFEMIREPYIKYICPNAPIASVTLNGGMRMPSWFDIISLAAGDQEDDKGIKKAAENLRTLIAEEEKHVPSNRIIIGGFSQGGAVALYTALTMEKQVGGVLALSTWLCLSHGFPAALKWKSSTPVLQCHGQADPLVRPHLATLTNEALKSFNATDYQFKTYPGMGHSSCEEEMQDVKEWIHRVLPPKD